jgi:hypothetical protein
MRNNKRKSKILKKKIRKLYLIHAKDKRTTNALAYSTDLY